MKNEMDDFYKPIPHEFTEETMKFFELFGYAVWDMRNEIHFENGIRHEFKEEEMELFKLLVREHAGEVALKHKIDVDVAVVLKTLFEVKKIKGAWDFYENPTRHEFTDEERKLKNMRNEMHFENGIDHEFTDEEMKLLRLLVAEHAGEVALKHKIDVDAVVLLKTLFFERKD